jgi:hypothetical protein
MVGSGSRDPVFGVIQGPCVGLDRIVESSRRATGDAEQIPKVESVAASALSGKSF